jgi:uncharacterized protein YkwD
VRKTVRVSLGTCGSLIFLLSVFVAGLLAGLAVARADVNNDPSVALDTEEQEFGRLINQYRADNGLGPLSVTLTLTEANDWHDKDMARNAYFSHNDSLNRDPWTRYCAYGYCYNTYKGENIAAGFTTAQSVFTAWENSPGHNANMLGSHYTVIGIARYICSPEEHCQYGVYWATGFGGVDPGQPVPIEGSPTSTPPPSATATPTARPTTTATPSPTPSRTPIVTPTTPATATAIATNTPTSTPSPTSSTSPTASPTPTSCKGDFNHDGIVNGQDVATFGAMYNTRAGDPAYRADHDFNQDGLINGRDVGQMGALFGPCNPDRTPA